MQNVETSYEKSTVPQCSKSVSQEESNFPVADESETKTSCQPESIPPHTMRKISVYANSTRAIGAKMPKNADRSD
ncbi:hypothetical protein FACS1894111_00880 [Clostridia bacterium]|nr:hypothetical protein FACS1894111_00880 [Clostridia bacterium]